MNFDQQHVRTRRHRGAGHGRHLVANPSAVRRIGSHRKMRELVHDGDRANIQRIARVGFEGANTALAKNDLIVSARHNVFGREQQLFQGRRDASFEQNRLIDFPQFAQQIEILHVARAYLQDIEVGQHHLDLRNLHDFADHQQSKLIAGFAQKFKRFQTQSLEGIRRTARLESAAAKYASSGLGNLLSYIKKLLARFNRTGARHNDYFRSADLKAITEFDNSPLRTKGAAGEFVRRADAMNVLNTR